MTSSPTSPEITALALFVLGGATGVIDTEDVAVQAHAIAPGRFSWRKHPDQINLELVRVALSDARKPENGGLVSGKGRSGWSLTPAGVRWCEARADSLLSRDLKMRRSERRAGSVDEQRWQRERARVVTSPAWTAWRAGRGITREDVHDLFRIDRYVVGRARELKVNRLREMFASDEEISPFIEAVATTALEEG
ncbi:MAG: hypothetical protein ACOYXS_01225 [Chloroflexota bacterium]